MYLWPCLVAAALAGHPPGETLDAMAVDITPEGMGLLEPIATGLVPPDLAVPGFSDSSSPCLFGYTIDVHDMVAHTSIDALTITPTAEGRLVLDADATVSLNSPDDPFVLFTELLCIEDTCDAWVDPFHAGVSTSIGLTTGTDAYGQPILVADTDPLVVTQDLSGGDIGLSGCVLSDLSFLLDLFLPLVDGALQDAVVGLETEIDAALNGAFAALNFSDSVELTDGVALDIAIGVHNAVIDENGLRLIVDGSVATSQAAACVKAFDPGESLATPSSPPAIGSVPVGVDPGYHIGLAVSDDFVNQALYASWQAGLLCQTVDADLLGDALPLAFDTSLLGVLVGPVFTDLFPTPVPIAIGTRPEVAPTLDLAAGTDVVVDDLGLEIYAEIDDRQVLLTDVLLDLRAGLDPTFDPATGSIALGIDLSQAVGAQVLRNEFVPGTDAEIEDALGNLMGNPIIAGALGSALAGLSFSLPTLTVNGVNYGLTDLQVGAAGPASDFLGMYTWAGEVPFTSAGGCGGCEGSGCSGTTTSSTGCSLDTASCADTSSCTGSSLYYTGSSCDCSSGSGTSSTGGCGCAIPIPLIDGRFFAIGFAGLVAARRRART